MLQHSASVAMTVSNLHSLAADTNLLAGWASAAIPIKANNYQDVMVAARFVTHASNRQAGVINVYAVAALNDTPLWPDIFSAGTEGAEGAATVHDVEHIGLELLPLESIVVDNTASEEYSMAPKSLAQLFGGPIPPTHVFLFVTNTAASGTNPGLAASGSAVYYTPLVEV